MHFLPLNITCENLSVFKFEAFYNFICNELKKITIWCELDCVCSTHFNSFS